jgi:hypothetical protein
VLELVMTDEDLERAGTLIELIEVWEQGWWFGVNLSTAQIVGHRVELGAELDNLLRRYRRQMVKPRRDPD